MVSAPIVLYFISVVSKLIGYFFHSVTLDAEPWLKPSKSSSFQGSTAAGRVPTVLMSHFVPSLAFTLIVVTADRLITSPATSCWISKRRSPANSSTQPPANIAQHTATYSTFQQYSLSSSSPPAYIPLYTFYNFLVLTFGSLVFFISIILPYLY